MSVNEGKSIVNQGSTITVERMQRHEFLALEDSLILESSNPDMLFDSIFSDSKINYVIFSDFMANQKVVDEQKVNEEIANTGFGSSIAALIGTLR